MPDPVRRPAAIAAVIALVGCATALSGCVNRPAQLPPPPATVTIGLLTPGGTDLGTAARQGAQLAVDQVNAGHPDVVLPMAAGGAGRRSRFALAVGDTKGTPDGGARAVDQLTGQAPPAGLVIVDSAPVVQAVAGRTEKAAVPLIDGYATADALGQQGRQWYLRTAPDDAELLGAVFTALQEAAGTGRLLVLDGAGGAMPDLAQVAQSRGFAVVARLPLSTGPTTLAGKIDLQRPDAVIALTGSAGEAAAAAEVAQKMKSPAPVVAIGPGTAAAGPGLLRTVGWSADYASRNPVARSVADLYRKRFGRAMDEPAAEAFTAVVALAAAVRATVTTGALTTTRVRAAIRQTDLPATQLIMPWDGIQFDASGQNPFAAGVVEQRGRILYPRELAARS